VKSKQSYLGKQACCFVMFSSSVDAESIIGFYQSNSYCERASLVLYPHLALAEIARVRHHINIHGQTIKFQD